MPTSERPADAIDWSLTTWEGSRREQLRRWAALPLEQVIQAIEDMEELAEQFRQMRESGKLSATRSGQELTSESEARTVREPPPPYGSNDE